MTLSQFVLLLAGCVVLVLLLLTAVLQPYKSNGHNRINIFFLIVILFIVISVLGRFLASSETLRFKQFANLVLSLSFCIPVMYIFVIILYKFFAHRVWVQKLCKKLCRICIKQEDEDFERLLPERMVNVEECAVLLADPMEVST